MKKTLSIIAIGLVSLFSSEPARGEQPGSAPSHRSALDGASMTGAIPTTTAHTSGE